MLSPRDPIVLVLVVVLVLDFGRARLPNNLRPSRSRWFGERFDGLRTKNAPSRGVALGHGSARS
jgi:hypothetical protein